MKTLNDITEIIAKQLGEIANELLNDPENDQVIASVREKVNSIMKDYPIFAW
jgi:glycine hydroxymethyltransferase